MAPTCPASELASHPGVTASYLAGYVGMGMAVRGNVRVANAALSSFKRALETAFQAGAAPDPASRIFAVSAAVA